jgi:hypothetical protein
MTNWRTEVPGVITNCSTVVFLSLLLLSVLTSAPVAKSQTRLPGPEAREGNRSMDEYDRTINRMKNDAKAANKRRLNLFPQIDDDFQHIQMIHNEIVRMLQPDKGLNYERLSDLVGDLKKRSIRLRENLALPEPEKPEPRSTQSEAIADAHLKESIAELHDLVVSFVASPIFKNLGVVDANEIDAARDNLDDIIAMSDQIKREAKLLSKSAKP